jgi:hypothetical protein
MKKIIATLVASVIAASPVMAQQAATTNSNFNLGANGKPTEFVFNGQTFYQVTNPAIITNTIGTNVSSAAMSASAVMSAPSTAAVAGGAAAAPGAAMAAGFGGMGLVGGLLGLALVAAAVSGSSSSTASH